MKTKNLIIGLGEVGGSLEKILKCPGIDNSASNIPQADIIHICFPFSEDFVKQVKYYKNATQAEIVVIHSTVPVGTTSDCGEFAVHSPIRGKHPNLEDGIKNFVKFFGGKRAGEASLVFSNLGIDVITTDKSENTEAMKLWDTEIYREAIMLNKKIHEYCQKYGLDFDIVYTEANKTYNEGYAKLGHAEYAKYVLKFVDGPIGGHCVEPNHILLS